MHQTAADDDLLAHAVGIGFDPAVQRIKDLESLCQCFDLFLAILDIVDYFINSYTLLITGVLEMLAAGWFFKTTKILEALNRNTKTIKMPSWWFLPSIKVISPVVLAGLFIWNLVNLIKGGGIYGAADGYSLKANIILGWCLVALILLSGLIIKIIVKLKSSKDFKEDDRTWDELGKS